MSPKVSVVIPTYNRADKVRKSIESVLAQTFRDIEVIVVDDGSSDETAQTLQDAFGDRIRYHFQPNQGVSAARNRGIEMARGEWIAFLDSDDFWEKEKIEWQLKALDRFGSQCGACYTDVRFFNNLEPHSMFQLSENQYRHEDAMGVNNDVLGLLVIPGGGGMVVCPSSFMASADTIRRAGGLDSGLRFQQDAEFMFRVAMLTGFCYVNRPLVWFDRSPAEIRHMDQLVPGVPRDAMCTDWARLEFILKDSEMLLNKLLQLKEVPGEVRRSMQKQRGFVHSGLANCSLMAGRYRDARIAAYKAARMNLTLNFAVKWLLTWVSPSLALRIVRHRESCVASTFGV